MTGSIHDATLSIKAVYVCKRSRTMAPLQVSLLACYRAHVSMIVSGPEANCLQLLGNCLCIFSGQAVDYAAGIVQTVVPEPQEDVIYQIQSS